MKAFRHRLGKIKLRLQNKNVVIGWRLTPDETMAFFEQQGKKVLTFFGYSTTYENKDALVKIVMDVLSGYSPETTIINIGATRGGIGETYPLAKSLGFTTTGIVSSQALDCLGEISSAVDYVCFVDDEQWGGKLPDSDELSPTSEAMVACSDVLVGIGGNEISRDEMLAGKAQGKPVRFYPAEMDHAWAIRRAEYLGVPPPDSFQGAAHDVFGK